MIFTADKERDIIDKLTGENRILKEQIKDLQLELETKKTTTAHHLFLKKKLNTNAKKKKDFSEKFRISAIYTTKKLKN